jgi:glycosyltransferase involved in cell wall biosynthesis
MNSEIVSIIIPAFNAQNTIVEAVNSVLDGTYKNIEILIINDASTDNTEKVINQLAQKYSLIKLHTNELNLGISKSRNLLIKQAKGKYIAFLDSDDTWEPNKLEKCIQTLRENPDLKAVGHAMRYLGKQGRKLGYLSAYPTTREELKTLIANACLPNFFPSTVVIERATLLKEGGFREDWEVGEDTELFARITQYGFIALTEPLANYRLKGGSLTDKYWLEKRLSNDCVIENISRRKNGKKELSLQDYTKIFLKTTPAFKKFNILRKVLATRYMRKVGENWLNQKVITAICYAVLVIFLNPQELTNKLQKLQSY